MSTTNNAAAILIAAAFVFGGTPTGATAQVPIPVSPNAPDKPPVGPVSATHQQLSISGAFRSYEIGDTTITERTGGLSYDGRRGRLRLRLDGTGLSYTAPPASITGSSPFSGRLDWAATRRDTITIYGRTSSSPTFLDSASTDAIGAAATSTIDLESFWLGTPSMAGGRVALGHQLGSGGAISVRAAVEVEPKPSGTLPIYWRGTSLMGGATIAGSSGDIDLSLRVDVRESWADSLDGRNLFPGGGLAMVRGALERTFYNPIDPLADDGFLSLSAFYSKNIGADRNNQPNRLIQTGNFVASTMFLSVPWRETVLMPSVEALRESSASHGTSTLDESTGSAWAMRLGIASIIPTGRVFDLTPEAGYAFGKINTSYYRVGTGRVTAYEQVAVASPVHGWWARLELTASW